MLEAAEAVAAGDGIASADVLALLSQLVDKSLLAAEDQAGRTRYRLLETIRQYATERLVEAGEAEVVRARHAAWCLALAEAAVPELAGPDQAAWLDRLEQEHDNLRVALSWSLDHEVELALRLAANLWQFWERRGHFEEGGRWLAALLPQAPERTSLRAAILCGAGVLARRAGHQKLAWAFLQDSLAVAREVGDKRAIGLALQWLAFCADHDPACAVALCEESIRLFQEVGEAGLVWSGTGLAWSVSLLGVVLYRHGDPGRGRRLMEETLRLARQAGHIRLVGWVQGHLSHVARHDGDYDHAQALLEEAMQHFQAIGTEWEIGWTLAHLANLARLRGDRGEAVRRFGEAIALLGRERSEFYLSQTLSWASILAVEAGAYGTAARLAGAAAGLSTPENYVPDPDEAADVEASLVAARATLGQAAFDRAWFAGRALTLDRAVDYALTVLPSLAGGDSRPAPRRDEGLTPREQEVAALLARGLTNRQIAAELVMAQKTVATHVSAILNKLHLTCRAEVAAWAEDRGLLAAKR
jgi:non-specific serine/threonine protein kinase